MKPKTKILIIAGSDSSGGAGIQADIKTVTSLGGYAMTAVTAITAQNTTGVSSIVAIPPKQITKHIVFTAQDIKPDAIKIGILLSKKVFREIIGFLKKINITKVVLDPVMVAKGGAKLINDQAISILRDELIKRVFLITPNVPEAEVLIGRKINNMDEMILAGYMLIHLGAQNVLIKGGHLKGSIVQDILVSKNELHIFKNKKLLLKKDRFFPYQYHFKLNFLELQKCKKKKMEPFRFHLSHDKGERRGLNVLTCHHCIPVQIGEYIFSKNAESPVLLGAVKDQHLL